MDKIENQLDIIKGIPLSGNDLQKIAPGKVILIRDLGLYSSIDEMIHPHDCCYLLYEFKDRVGHWCCLTRRGGLIEFFDPYGKPIDSQIEFIPGAFAKATGQDRKLLTQLLIDCPYDISYNEFSFQRWDKETKNCGRWCGMRCLLKLMTLEQFNTLFLEDYEKGGSDYIVSLLTSDIGTK